MTRLAEPLRDFVRRMEWEDDVEDRDDKASAHLSTRIVVGGQPCQLYIDAQDNLDAISVFCYLPFHAPQANLAQACVLSNAINRRSRHCRVEIDPDDGEIRGVVSADFEGLEPTGANVEAMFHFCVGVLRDWMPAIAEVAVVGRPARDVLAARDASARVAADEEPGELDGRDDNDDAGRDGDWRQPA